MLRRPPRSTLFPYTNALPICIGDHVPVRAEVAVLVLLAGGEREAQAGRFGRAWWRGARAADRALRIDRKSTRLNSSHGYISYAVFCLKKKKKQTKNDRYTEIK